jgi:uncharacterized protein involved in exopolysaccharide biosynthesis
VAALRDEIRITPPKGTEFGKTEIFYLKVKDRQRSRAVVLAAAVARQLQVGLKQLRESKAQSMMDELNNSVELARADLTASTRKLAELEASVGADLGELRMLDLSATGDSDLRRVLTDIDQELRATEAAQQSNGELLRLLVAAQEDAGRLLATPNRLLESQPALKRLKDGLVDAQLRTAQLLSTMTLTHPQALAAKEAEREIGQHLHSELAIAIRGVELDLRLSDERRQTLSRQRQGINQRLDRLAKLRADYSRLVADVRHRTELTEKSQRDLAEARASLAGAHGSSLITLVDRPEIGGQPTDPSNNMVLLAGLGGGLLCGLGLVFLTAQPVVTPAPVVTHPLRRTNDPSPPVHRRTASEIGLSLKQALGSFMARSSAN